MLYCTLKGAFRCLNFCSPDYSILTNNEIGDNCLDVYQLHEKSGWNAMLAMVQDFLGVAFRQAQVTRGWKKTIMSQNGSCICSVERWKKRPKWEFGTGKEEYI